MSDFEEYIKVNYPRDYERQKRIYPDQSMEELYSEDYKMWQHQQAIIDELKAQLNNMEACYIEKKKEVEELQKTNISLEAGLRKNSKNKQKLLGKNIELQKRIDDGLQVIFECRVMGADRIYTCDMTEKALRGEL